MRDRAPALDEEPAGSSEPPAGEFTAWVRALDRAGEPPDEESFQPLWRALRAALAGELKRRGLWSLPPRYLGLYGEPAWSEEALDELAVAAYLHVFEARYDYLRRQLRARPAVDGLVLLCLRQFISEEQKRNDPLGFRVYTVLHRAVTAAVEAGELHLPEGDDDGIRNRTLLRLAPASAGETAAPPAAAELAGLAAAWCPALLPELVTARGERLEAVVRELRRRLAELPRQGVDAFPFQDLAAGLKAGVRSWWASALAVTATAAGAAAATATEPRAFSALTRCVGQRLRRLDLDRTTYRYLSALWSFLCIFASESAGAATPRLSLEMAAATTAEELPPDRRLARLLDIPRHRFPQLRQRLGELVRSCTEAPSAAGSPGPAGARPEGEKR